VRRFRFVLIILLMTCTGIVAYAQYGLPPLKEIKVTNAEIKKMAKTTVVIETKFGNMKVRFLPESAPATVKNFLDLARSGFYDGTIFHRVIPGFMIQGGDPTTKDPARVRAYGTGGPGYTIKAEFNKTKHKRGILSMARMNDPNSAGSQFFICFDMQPEQEAMIDGNYTAFGEVVSGMEVADKIAALPQNPMTNNPNERVEIKMKVVEGK
jgi:peptidyl-prolyl cis-trans isomerase B (cyclophilin B)